MIWYILILLFFILLIWILLVPVILFLNTDTNHYHLSLPGIFKVAVVPSKELFHLKGWIFFIPYKYQPFRRKKRGKWKRKKATDKPRKKRRSERLAGGLKMMNAALHSFKIRKLHLDIDTDDYLLNARLVPVFSIANSGNIQMRTNFEGTSSLLLDMRFRLGTLLWILITKKYKSFFNL